MSSEKIYPIFLQKLKENSFLKVLGKEDIPLHKGKFQVIISFEDISNRDQFVSENQKLNILKITDFIPSIVLSLTYKEILSLEKNKLIKNIEEDQNLYLSILKVNEIIELNNYRKTPIIFTGKNIIIGIIDNGINNKIDSIYDIIIKQYPVSEIKEELKTKKSHNKRITHGTLMANIIGNQYLDYYDNIVGIAPNARIIDFNISNNLVEYHFSDIIEIFDLITKEKIKTDIILISFTTLEPSDGRDILSNACNLLADKGFIIICPAGNFGPESYTIGSPGAAEKVITVGSITKNKALAYFSSRGPTLDNRIKPDIYFPGSRIIIPLSNRIKIELSGTSISSAICAGMIALIKEMNSDLTYKEILEIINKSSYNLNLDKKIEGKTTDIIRLFKELNIFQEPTLPYNYLIKRAVKFSIEFVSFLIILFFLFYFIDFSQFF